jgi:tripartite-type tricarboxylate transporter receptor subunit TctC
MHSGSGFGIRDSGNCNPLLFVRWMLIPESGILTLAAASIKVLALVMALPAAASSAVQTGDYPTRPVRIVVPSTPGGALDILSRLLAMKLPERWGQQIVADNRAGAGGIIGSEIVSKSAPDGHTLLVVALGYAANPYLYDKLPYRTPDDFAAITVMASAPNVLVVHPSVSAHSVKELIALAKSTPMTYASSGIGTSGHLAMELFKSMAKVDITQVPYKGAGASNAAIVAGQVQILSTALGAAHPFIKAGRLRAIAVTGERRAMALPEVPTAIESGLPGYVVDGWFAALAPAKTSPRIVEKIQTDMAAALRLPDVAERLAVAGFEPGGMSPKETDRFIAAEMRKWGKVIKEARIKGE